MVCDTGPMKDDFVEIDVRSLLDQGRSPLPLIMNTVASLEPGQGLQLITSWEPLPLYEVLAGLGFTHSSHQVDGDHWVIDFTRSGDGAAPENYNPPCIL